MAQRRVDFRSFGGEFLVDGDFEFIKGKPDKLPQPVSSSFEVFRARQRSVWRRMVSSPPPKLTMSTHTTTTVQRGTRRRATAWLSRR